METQVEKHCNPCKFYWEDLKFCYPRKEFTWSHDFKVALNQKGKCRYLALPEIGA